MERVDLAGSYRILSIWLLFHFLQINRIEPSIQTNIKAILVRVEELIQSFNTRS